MKTWRDEHGQALCIGDRVMAQLGDGLCIGLIVGNPNGGDWYVRREKVFRKDTLQFELLPCGGPNEGYDRRLWPDMTERQWRRMGRRIPGVTLIEKKPLRGWRPGLIGQAGIDFEAPVPVALW